MSRVCGAFLYAWCIAVAKVGILDLDENWLERLAVALRAPCQRVSPSTPAVPTYCRGEVWGGHSFTIVAPSNALFPPLGIAVSCA